MKNLFIILFICISVNIMSEDCFYVCKKNEVNEFIREYKKANKSLNLIENTNMELNILDVKLDNSEDGWAVIKYNIICK